MIPGDIHDLGHLLCIHIEEYSSFTSTWLCQDRVILNAIVGLLSYHYSIISFAKMSKEVWKILVLIKMWTYHFVFLPHVILNVPSILLSCLIVIPWNSIDTRSTYYFLATFRNPWSRTHLNPHCNPWQP